MKGNLRTKYKFPAQKGCPFTFYSNEWLVIKQRVKKSSPNLTWGPKFLRKDWPDNSTTGFVQSECLNAAFIYFNVINLLWLVLDIFERITLTQIQKFKIRCFLK